MLISKNSSPNLARNKANKGTNVNKNNNVNFKAKRRIECGYFGPRVVNGFMLEIQKAIPEGVKFYYPVLTVKTDGNTRLKDMNLCDIIHSYNEAKNKEQCLRKMFCEPENK